ncbi:MAG TPA: NUDIX domain-containing protein [Phycisphaerae bacterium]|nr:NUDIX domain-containing protein [Phycisphaerae bacterium]
MPLERKIPIVVAAVIERQDGFVLICRPETEDGPRHWEFPGGEARQGESPEKAVRRTASERAGVHVEIHVGQPPLRVERDGRDVEYRFFLCGLQTGEACAEDYAEVRWVAKAQLCEYDFEHPTCDVVQWLGSSGQQ